ncbi:sensor histidine kinase [Vibrio tritonius]|uniref:sensor histidine kinase n=1 Tax=Vibrio tritonius TaxID=1435069 RepID=UPI000837C4B4|nr:ATP-binding protein [Vibrio tritonius]
MLPLRRFNVYFVLLYLFVTALTAHWVWHYSYQSLITDHTTQLERFSSHIAAKLDKYATIPRLLSKDRELIDALLSPNNSAQIEITNRFLEQVNNVIQASDTYLLDPKGTTIAASNWSLGRTFIGRNFAWRPYFYEAIVGDSSQYFALGSTSGERGYYYSYPVIYAAEIIGVVVVKMDLTAIEDNWQNPDSYFVATDANSVIFMSSQPKWLFKSIIDLSPETREKIRNSRQYLNNTIPSLGFVADLTHSPAEWTNPKQGWLTGDMIVNSRPLSELNLNIRVLTPKMDLFWTTFGAVLILTMVFAIVYLILLLIYHRLARQRQIEQIQQEAKQKLEFLVMERTSELHAEVQERIRTEGALRQTQDELIQAAKLAMLGQMSASISHELNNPLAAIRGFADNARRFIAKGQIERVDDNLARISSLTDRMAKISNQLKSFARKSDAKEQVVAQLLPVILSAKELVQPQYQAHHVDLAIHTPEQPIWVSMNPIQLEQVLINLLTNALQAMENQEVKQVDIHLEVHEGLVMLFVDDNGPGVPLDKRIHLFDPFYTTKKNGLGLGLSISHQIIASLNGKLTVTEAPRGGARFVIALPEVEVPMVLSPPPPENQH